MNNILYDERCVRHVPRPYVVRYYYYTHARARSSSRSSRVRALRYKNEHHMRVAWYRFWFLLPYTTNMSGH